MKIFRIVVEELPENCWSCELLGMCGVNTALPTCCDDDITRKGRVKDCPLELGSEPIKVENGH